MLEKKIALLTSVTFNNIGNGFIDLGAEAALMKALPLNAELFKVTAGRNSRKRPDLELPIYSAALLTSGPTTGRATSPL